MLGLERVLLLRHRLYPKQNLNTKGLTEVVYLAGWMQGRVSFSLGDG